MSIFGNSISLFTSRRRDSIWTPPYSVFYAAWPLLRMQSEQLHRSPIRVRYHWQQDRYRWRDQGRFKKPRKTSPKAFRKIPSPYQQAYRWLRACIPLT